MAWQFSKGLHAIGGNSYAWLNPDGGWGLSNSGLVVDGDQSLLIDTQFDLRMTAEMLAAMADATPAARSIDVLVNSHADGDHTFGNQLVAGARIIASQATANEFFKLTPDRIHAIVTNWETLGDGAKYIFERMGPDRFDFSNITMVGPSETFDRVLSLKVGDKDVVLTNVGPAHTSGDTLVQVVQDRVVYTGDLLFVGGHPAIWDGSVDGWIAACDRILAMDVDIVVPGHGPITDKKGVRVFRDYLVMLVSETRRRFEAGMGVEEAALDIILTPPFSEWTTPERIAGNVNFIFRQLGSPDATDNFMEILARVARYAAARERQCDGHTHSAGCGHAH